MAEPIKHEIIVDMSLARKAEEYKAEIDRRINERR